MTDWSKPTTASTYSNYTTELANRDASLAVGMDSALVSDTNVLTNTVRWNSTNKNWERWNGAAWGALAATYGISISGNALTSSSCSGNAATATNGVPAGTIIDFGGTSAPSGYLACPLSAGGAQVISRTTYAALFSAIGTTWGAGDGSTTFGMPWFAADMVGVQASANVGTSTHGALLAHTHALSNGSSVNPGGSVDDCIATSATHTAVTQSTGGTDNLAAGARVLKCVKT
jgi:microcystin-dependent protein